MRVEHILDAAANNGKRDRGKKPSGYAHDDNDWH